MSSNSEAEVVLRDVFPLLTLVLSALEHGTFKVQEYFENEEVDVDRCLAPSLVRFWAKKELERTGHDVKEEEEEDFDLEHVTNIGLCLTYRHYHIRILKSFDGGLPVPGQSKKRRELYNQQIEMFDYTSNDDRVSSPSTLNLIILWDVDELYNLQDLRLACPKAGDFTRASVQVHWNVPIPHPVLSIDASVEVQTEMEEAVDDNLPIYVVRPADTETGDVG